MEKISWLTFLGHPVYTSLKTTFSGQLATMLSLTIRSIFILLALLPSKSAKSREIPDKL